MWFNVWFVIWPRQKQILGGMLSRHAPPRRGRAGGHGAEGVALQHLRLGPDAVRHDRPQQLRRAAAHGGMGLALILGIGFWFGMIKRSFKVKPEV